MFPAAGPGEGPHYLPVRKGHQEVHREAAKRRDWLRSPHGSSEDVPKGAIGGGSLHPLTAAAPSAFREVSMAETELLGGGDPWPGWEEGAGFIAGKGRDEIYSWLPSFSPGSAARSCRGLEPSIFGCPTSGWGYRGPQGSISAGETLVESRHPTSRKAFRVSESPVDAGMCLTDLSLSLKCPAYPSPDPARS